jgi:hypothetical protein
MKPKPFSALNRVASYVWWKSGRTWAPVDAS